MAGDTDFDQELARMAQQRAAENPAQVPDRRKSDAEIEEARRKRRHIIRHDCIAQVSMNVNYAVAGDAENWQADSFKVKARVLDLSLDGASLYTKECFDANQGLALKLKLRGGTIIEAPAVVRWVKPVKGKSAYSTGVSFRGLKPEELKKIEKFLGELDETLGL